MPCLHIWTVHWLVSFFHRQKTMFSFPFCYRVFSWFVSPSTIFISIISFSRSLHTLPGTLKMIPLLRFTQAFSFPLSFFLCLPASLDPITLGSIHVGWSHRFQIFVSLSLSSSHSHTHTQKIHAQTHTGRAYQAGVLNINILLIWQLGMMWFDVCVHVCVMCTHHF